MCDKIRYNARMRVYMHNYRKSQRERIDEVLAVTSELLARLNESNILENSTKKFAENTVISNSAFAKEARRRLE